MLINSAFASDVATTASDVAPATGAFVMQPIILMFVLVVLFYFLLILPQKKRFKEHKEMLDGLKKGDKIVTAGGLVGTVDDIKDGDDEITIDLNGTKVTALRSSIHQKVDKQAKPANDKGETVKK